MTAAILEKANEAMRAAVRERLANTDPNDEKMIGYKLDQGDPEPSCCEGTRMRGDSLLGDDLHPVSRAFFDLCDQLKEMHRRKSRDYGCPSGEDPLANIRNGARFVGIPAWKGAMVRLSDKVTRLAAYNATGRLENESLEDNLADLASYSLLALLLHREERDGS
jgi:hypothetical protein